MVVIFPISDLFSSDDLLRGQSLNATLGFIEGPLAYTIRTAIGLLVLVEQLSVIVLHLLDDVLLGQRLVYDFLDPFLLLSDAKQLLIAMYR